MLQQLLMTAYIVTKVSVNLLMLGLELGLACLYLRTDIGRMPILHFWKEYTIGPTFPFSGLK